MKKIIAVILMTIILLSPLIALAGAKSDAPKHGTLFDDVFMQYAPAMEQYSYNDVDRFLSTTDYTIEAVAPSDKVYAKHSVYDKNGDYVYIAYFPLDNSFSSKDYGNPDKEVITLISYHSGPQSICASTGFHTSLVRYSKYDESVQKKDDEVDSLSDLLAYYKNDMGGTVLGNYPHLPLSPKITAASALYKIEQSVNKHFEKSTDNEVSYMRDEKSVLIKALGKDNLSANMIKKGMWLSIYNVLKDTQSVDVGTIYFQVLFPLVDSLGNEQNAVVMKATFPKDLRSKVNWKNFIFNDVPNAAKNYWQHKALPE